MSKTKRGLKYQSQSSTSRIRPREALYWSPNIGSSALRVLSHMLICQETNAEQHRGQFSKKLSLTQRGSVRCLPRLALVAILLLLSTTNAEEPQKGKIFCRTPFRGQSRICYLHSNLYYEQPFATFFAAKGCPPMTRILQGSLLRPLL